jgi:predicted DsbA family dithiol-disulfide isomerase
MNQGPTGQNSRPALIGAKYAEAQGRGKAYHDALLRGYWQEGRAIEAADDLVVFATAVGLDPVGFRAALTDPQYEALVDTDIQQAQIYGLNGVPALVFENRYLLSGAQPVATLRQVCDRVLSEQ